MSKIVKRILTPYRSVLDTPNSYDYRGNSIGIRRTYVFGVLVSVTEFQFS